MLRRGLNFTTTIYRSKHDFTVTTPIFYCNAGPHIGHLYTAVLADAAKRFNQLLGKNHVNFVTGTDEHGTKIQRAAAAHNLSPPVFCDNVSAEYRKLFEYCEIDFTCFIRTTENRHIEAVQHFWKKLADCGHIYSGSYSGWYCVADEAFLTDTQVKEIANPAKGGQNIQVSVESGQPVEWTTEENLMFKLSSFQNDLLCWLKNDNVVKPKNFHAVLTRWLMEMELEDLSVSRPANRVPWGIPVPHNPEQTVYVWLDALVNYLTAAGYPNHAEFKDNWPPTVQIIGKDILKFHGIYWPAFLIAAGLDPPRQLLVHSHWTVDSEKMSKSRGNVVTPPSPSNGGSLQELIGMRYFLLRVGTPQKDNNFSKSLMEEEVNASLVNALGNLLSRCTGDILNPMQVYPALPDTLPLCTECSKLMTAIENLAESVKPDYMDCNFYLGITSVLQTIGLANEFFQAMEPWKFSKEEKEAGYQLPTIHITMEALRVCGIALLPIVPSVASTLLTRLGIPETERQWVHMQDVSWKGGNSKFGYKLGIGPLKLFEKIGENDKKEANKKVVKDKTHEIKAKGKVKSKSSAKNVG